MTQRYPAFDFTHGGITHPVYRMGDAGRTSILLIQELPGITPETLALAERLNDDGFTVYLPHLFGDFGAEQAPIRNIGDICIRREFYLLDRRKSAPFTEWLRALCRRMQDESGGPVGAIGQCLTGSFVIPLMIDAVCAAPVANQPGHFGKVWTDAWKSSLGLEATDEQRAIAASKEHDIPLLAMRFKRDPTCPKQRFDRMEREFGERFTRVDLTPPKRGKLDRPAHSVLTIDYDATPGSNTEQAYRQLIQYFEQHLGRAA